MTVRDLLSKLLYDTSTIHRAFVVRAGSETELVGVLDDPENCTLFDDLLDSYVSAFRISCVDMFIFVK